eukprot:3706734-Pleurochrysis_carterae.AAC.7
MADLPNGVPLASNKMRASASEPLPKLVKKVLPSKPDGPVDRTLLAKRIIRLAHCCATVLLKSDSPRRRLRHRHAVPRNELSDR